MTDNMTQTNNEREALLDKLLAEYWDIAYSEGNSGLWRGKKAQSTLNDIRKLFKTQSPISQNEQQEAVAFMDEDGEIYALPEQKSLNISIDDLIKSIGKNGVRLYTSPPKQAIPEGWKLVPIESDEKMKDGARAFLAGLELGTKTFENMSEHLRLSGAYLPDWFLNSRGHINKMAKAHYIYDSMISVAPTNREVGE